MIRKYILIGGLILSVLGCSRNQIRTNRMDGEWDITKVETYSSDGETSYSSDPEGKFEFDRCSLRKEGLCPYTQQSSYTIGATTFSINAEGEYHFDDKGQKLELRESNGDGTYDTYIYDVIDFKYKRLRIETRDSDGVRTVFTLEKNE